MELIYTRKVDFCYEDNRGSLTQLVHEGFEQINILITNHGVTRGGHFHKQSKEAFFIQSGTVEVTAKLKGIKKIYTFNQGDFFEIPPYVSHSMYFPEDCIMVQLYDKCVELPDGTKDIFTEDQI